MGICAFLSDLKRECIPKRRANYVRKIGSPRCDVYVGCEGGWCVMTVAVWVARGDVLGPGYILKYSIGQLA